MIVGKKPNHSNHDQALTTFLETARRCNVQLNYEKLKYKKQEVDFSVKLKLQAVASLIRTRLEQSPKCLHQQTRNKYNPLLDQRIGKGQGTFQLGPRTSICLYTDERRDCKHSHTGLLQTKEANCVTN